jgi:hypothetical protein
MHFSRDHLTSVLISGCTLLAALWLVAAHFNRGFKQAYDLTFDDFADFQPALEGCTIEKLPRASPDATDANIVAFILASPPSALSGLDRQGSQQGSMPDPRSPNTTHNLPSRFLVRLVHGYSMPMCMKRKSYTVEKIQDHEVRSTTDPKLLSAFKMAGNSGSPITDNGATEAPRIPPSYPFPVQLWRLTSSVGDVAYWVTTMIRSGDFEPTKEDICSMRYPVVNYPDDPNWTPRGLSLETLKNPRDAFWCWFNSRWDGSGWDVLTFLGLRPGAAGSAELLSYMTIVNIESSDAQTHAVDEALMRHAAMLKEFQKWRGNAAGSPQAVPPLPAAAEPFR